MVIIWCLFKPGRFIPAGLFDLHSTLYTTPFPSCLSLFAPVYSFSFLFAPVPESIFYTLSIFRLQFEINFNLKLQ